MEGRKREEGRVGGYTSSKEKRNSHFEICLEYFLFIRPALKENYFISTSQQMEMVIFNSSPL